MIVILENGGLNSEIFKDSGEAWSSLVLFNYILNTLARADNIEEAHLRLTSIFADFRLHNKPTPFMFGFNEERTEMEVYQDNKVERLILVKSED